MLAVPVQLRVLVRSRLWRGFRRTDCSRTAFRSDVGLGLSDWLDPKRKRFGYVELEFKSRDCSRTASRSDVGLGLSEWFGPKRKRFGYVELEFKSRDCSRTASRSDRIGKPFKFSGLNFAESS